MTSVSSKTHESGWAEFLFNPDPAWSEVQSGALKAKYSGREATVRELLRRLPDGRPPGEDRLSECLNVLPGHFAAWIEAPGYFLAVADTVRSIPLFYARRDDRFVFSNDARTAAQALSLSETDEDALLEFFLSGYVIGNSTLLKGLGQLRAGEAAIADRKGEGLKFRRYYIFYSGERRPDDESALTDEVARRTDTIFDRLAGDLDGRPVWVPLSAGLDSRLIACKLAERGYPKVQTFSYGIPGNQEAKYARRSAEQAGLPWLFVDLTGADHRRFFESETRKKYWRYSDGLCGVPNPQDIAPLLKLREQGLLTDDAFIVNGQSGDFITGNHIPATLIDDSEKDLFQMLMNKHFALWRDIATETNLARMRSRLEHQAREMDPEYAKHPAAIHDCLEWQERQAKYVVSGQRIYDFMGLEWRLPLWEDEYMRFWREVPLSWRKGQRLYVRYLSKWNYKGLFEGAKPTVSHWPGWRNIFFVLAQVAGLAGRRRKDLFYAYARYFGHYGHLWNMIPFGRFLKEASKARNVLSFMTDIWAEENLGPGISHRKFKE